MKKGSDHEANPECTGQSLEKVRGVNIDEQGNQVAQIVQTEIIYRVAPKADNQEFISGAKQDLTRLSLESEHVSVIYAEAKLGDSVYVGVNKVSDHGAKMTRDGLSLEKDPGDSAQAGCVGAKPDKTVRICVDEIVKARCAGAKLDRDMLSLEKKPGDHAQAGGAGARSDNNVRIVHVQARGAGAKL